MINEQEITNNIIFFLIHHQQVLKNLCKPILEQRKKLLDTEPIEFHEDIIAQGNELCLSIIIVEITRNIPVDYILIKSILEDFNINEFLDK